MSSGLIRQSEPRLQVANTLDNIYSEEYYLVGYNAV
jgi:hypothetical protein